MSHSMLCFIKTSSYHPDPNRTAVQDYDAIGKDALGDGLERGMSLRGTFVLCFSMYILTSTLCGYFSFCIH